MQSRFSYPYERIGTMAKKRRSKHEGTVYQREDGTWRTQLSYKGKRYSFSANNEMACHQWRIQKREQLERGEDYDLTRRYVADYLSEWIHLYQVRLKENTAYQYKLTIDRHIVPYIGKIELLSIHPMQLERFYRQLLDEGRGRRTVEMVHRVLSNAFKHAVRYRIIPSNPAEGAILPKKQKKEMLVWNEYQVQTFLQFATGSRYESLYQLAILTGMRQAELFGLKWGDIDWNLRLLHVRRQAQALETGGWQFTDPKTRAGTRSIQLGEGSLSALRAQRIRQDAEKALAGNRWKEYDLVLTSSLGTPIHRSNFRIDFNRIIKEAGIPKIRFHDLRHTAASLMLMHGIPMLAVSQILGHSKPSITLDLYGHYVPGIQNGAAELMDRLVMPVGVQLGVEIQPGMRA
jgi:integrase